MNELLIDNIMIMCAYHHFVSCDAVRNAYELALAKIVHYETHITPSDSATICDGNLHKDAIRHAIIVVTTKNRDLAQVARIRKSPFYGDMMRRYRAHVTSGVSRYRSA